MNDAQIQEIDRQHLIEILNREDGLMLKLEAAQKEVEQLKGRAIAHEYQLHEINDLLEAEEAKTYAERVARENAEATVCHYRAEALEAKRKERVANEHCDEAESEILRLQKELATERCMMATANRLLGQAREDLVLAEANWRGSYEQLRAAKAKVNTLHHDLAISNDRVRILEDQADDLVEANLKQHQKVECAELALRTMACELEDSNMKLCDSMERHKDLELAHKRCTLSTAAVASAAAELGGAHADKWSLHSVYKRKKSWNRVRWASSSELWQVPWSDESMGDRMIDKLTLSTVETQMNVDPGTLVCSESAIANPVPASVVVGEVELLKTSGKSLNGPRAIGKDPPWRLLYWLRPDSLRFLCRTCLGR
ncbi:hypothetical protein BDR22DRAFT_959302 [Usnea florida]